jgi:hypothetical protein
MSYTATTDFGSVDFVATVFSYPNGSDIGETLQQTVEHWINLSLLRDGLTAQGVACSTALGDMGQFFLSLTGPEALQPQLDLFLARLQQFHVIGWTAITQVMPKIKADGKWDPSPDPEPPPYRPWRPFLPHGMALINQRSLQFFHYPPIRLLEQTRDYLDDPVPTRWEELLIANGVPAEQQAWLYETVVDATPIAAEDDQGSKPPGGLIPIQYFPDYQKALTQLLLNTAANNADCTIPIVVYGAPPRKAFNSLFGTNIGVNTVGVAQIIPGKKTPVLGANHPYVFYATAQGFNTVGSGKFLPPPACVDATSVMKKDLAVAFWQKKMADDPTQDPQAVINAATAFWNDPAQAALVCQLVQHQGSLFYPDDSGLTYQFNVSMQQAAAYCSANGNNPCAS